LLQLRHLRELTIRVSGLIHDGANVQALAQAISDSQLSTLCLSLRTAERKGVVVIMSEHHKEQKLDKLGEALLTAGPEFTVKVTGLHQPEMVIKRCQETLQQQLVQLANANSDSDVLHLDDSLTLSFLFCADARKSIASFATTSNLWLYLCFTQNMTDATVRRLKKLKSEQVVGIRWHNRDVKAVSALSASCAAIRQLQNVFVSYAKPCPLMQLPIFSHLTVLALTGSPNIDHVPHSVEDLSIQAHRPKGEGEYAYVHDVLDFDFSNFHNIRKLVMQAAGATYRVLRLPPNVQELELEYVEVSPTATDRMAGAMDTLTLNSYELLGSADLNVWLQQANPQELTLGPGGSFNTTGNRWCLGPSREGFLQTLLASQLRVLRDSLAGAFDFHDTCIFHWGDAHGGDALTFEGLAGYVETNLSSQCRLVTEKYTGSGKWEVVEKPIEAPSSQAPLASGMYRRRLEIERNM